MPTRICFIRHGETDWNATRRIQGQADIPLNGTGKSQALALAFNAAHYNFSAIYSSDLVRAYDTAQVVALRCGLEVQKLQQLRERNFGIFQGLTADEGKEKFPEAYAHYQARDLHYDFENGESMLQFAVRVEQAVDHMVRHHQNEVIAAVCHAGVLDIIYRKSTGRPLHTPRDFAIPNCALNWFCFDAHRGETRDWHLEAWNSHHHLAKALMESVE